MMTLGDMLMGRPVTLPDGRICEPRKRGYAQTYIEKNREEIYRKKRERYAANKEAINARQREKYAALSPEKRAERNRASTEWAQENVEKMRRYQRAHYRRKRKEALARTAEHVKAWRKAEDRGAFLVALKSGDADQRRAAKWIVHGKR